MKIDLVDFEQNIFPELLNIYPKCVIDRNKSDDSSLVLRLPLDNKDDAEAFKNHLTTFMNVEWIVYFSQPKFDRVIYSKTWLCQHSTKNKKSPEESKRNASCKANLKLTIKKVNRNTKKNNKFLTQDPPLSAEVYIHLTHTPEISSAEALKMLRVKEEVKQAYFEYFSNGLSPAEAMRYHENKFLNEEDYEALSNSKINPYRRQVDHLHHIWREHNLGSYVNPLEMLKSKLDLYKANGTVVKIHEAETWAVLLSTPVMQRAQALVCSGEIVFVDSTCSCETISSTLTTVLTATKAGAIPIAVLIHDSQTAESYRNAFDLLKDSFLSCFGGKNCPSIFMTDDSFAEKTALHSVWQEAVQLLCHFHVAQAEWHWFFSTKNANSPNERQRLMRLFQAVMYAKTDLELSTAVTNLTNEKEKFPQFVKRFSSFYERRSEWGLLFRQDLVTRQHNTNNYAEATIRILKDIILCTTKAFNVVALCEFCMSMWENYLKKKLLDFVHGRRNGHQMYAKFCKKIENYKDDDLIKINEMTYSIKSKFIDDLCHRHCCWSMLM